MADKNNSRSKVSSRNNNAVYRMLSTGYNKSWLRNVAANNLFKGKAKMSQSWKGGEQRTKCELDIVQQLSLDQLCLLCITRIAKQCLLL